MNKPETTKVKASDVLQVRVTGFNKKEWYSNKIGQTFWVIDRGTNFFLHADYRLSTGFSHGRYITKDNCEIVHPKKFNCLNFGRCSDMPTGTCDTDCPKYIEKPIIESTPQQKHDSIKSMFLGTEKKEVDANKCGLCQQEMTPRYCCEPCDQEMMSDIIGGDFQELADLRKFFCIAEEILSKENLQRINAWYAVYRTQCPTQDEDKILHGNIVNYMRERKM